MKKKEKLMGITILILILIWISARPSKKSTEGQTNPASTTINQTNDLETANIVERRLPWMKSKIV